MHQTKSDSVNFFVSDRVGSTPLESKTVSSGTLHDLLAAPPQPLDRVSFLNLINDTSRTDHLTTEALIDLLRAGRSAKGWSLRQALDQINASTSWCDALEAAYARFGLPQDWVFLKQLHRFRASVQPLRLLLESQDIVPIDPGHPNTSLQFILALARPIRARCLEQQMSWNIDVRGKQPTALIWHLEHAHILLAQLARAYDLRLADPSLLASDLVHSVGLRFPLAVTKSDGRAQIMPVRLFLLACAGDGGDGRLPLIRISLPTRETKLDDGVKRGVATGLAAFNRLRLAQQKNPINIKIGFYDIGDPACDQAQLETELEAPFMAATLSLLAGQTYPHESLISGSFSLRGDRIAGVGRRVEAAILSGYSRFSLPQINRAEIEHRIQEKVNLKTEVKSFDPISELVKIGSFIWFEGVEGIVKNWQELMRSNAKPISNIHLKQKDQLPKLVQLRAKILQAPQDGKECCWIQIALRIDRFCQPLPSGEAQLALKGLILRVAAEGGTIEPVTLPDSLNLSNRKPRSVLPACLSGPVTPLDETIQPEWLLFPCENYTCCKNYTWHLSEKNGSALTGALVINRLVRFMPTQYPFRVRVTVELKPRFIILERASGLIQRGESRPRHLAASLLLWKLLAKDFTPYLSQQILTATNFAAQNHKT